MKPASLASSILVACTLWGCAGGAAAPDPSELSSLREEIRALRRDREADRRRLDLVVAQMEALARRTAAETRSAAPLVAPPGDLAVVRLEPGSQRTAAALPQAEDDSFIFIADGGSGAGATGGPDKAPSLPTKVELREPEDLVSGGYEQGMAALAAGNLEGAVSLLERFQRENPRDSRADNAGVALGDALRRLDRPEKALATWEKVATEYPAGDAVPEALLLYGETCLALGRKAAARAAFQRLVDNHPASTFASRARAHLAGG